MVVFLNNTQHTLSAPMTIASMIAALGITAGKGTALAVNNSVIPKAQWADYQLRDNDKVTLIRATQGG